MIDVTRKNISRTATPSIQLVVITHYPNATWWWALLQGISRVHFGDFGTG